MPVRADPQLASTPFLFMTGLDVREHLRTAMSLGADDYLAKPTTPADLVAAVEARLTKREAERGEAERRIAEVARSVSFLLPHELRTPLTVILGGSDMMRAMHHEMTREEIGEIATAISQAGHRLHRMAENYLLHAGMELQRLTAGATDVRALSGATSQHIVRDAALVQAREYGREQDVEIDIAEATLPIAEPYVRKIVSEVVDNALKFSEAGKVVKVALTRAGRSVTLKVADLGRGMSAEQIREIAAFRQFDRAVFEQQGSGLGLILVKGIIGASGGTLELTSAVGVGTTVLATWPAQD